MLISGGVTLYNHTDLVNTQVLFIIMNQLKNTFPQKGITHQSGTKNE